MPLPTSQPHSFEGHLRRTIRNDVQKPFVSYEIGSKWDTSLSPFAAAQNAAKKVYERYKSPIYIPLSGGIDSEAMARSFVAAEVPIIPVIMKFKNGFNDFDTCWADAYCEEAGLKPIVLQLDLEEFFLSGRHLEYATNFGCRSPQLATHLWMADQIQGPLVFPYNPLPIWETQKKKIYISFPPDLYLCYDIYFEKMNKPGLGLFFLYTADLIYSFFQLPLFLDMLFDHAAFSRMFSVNPYLIKNELYKAGGFDVTLRPNKATGFEEFRKYLNKKHSYQGVDFFDDNYRRPMEEIVQDPRMISTGDIDFKPLHNKWIGI